MARIPLRRGGGVVPLKRGGGAGARTRSKDNWHGATPLRGLIPFIAGLVIWELIGSPDSLSYPPPSTWFPALEDLWHQGVLQPAIKTTLEMFIGGFFAALILGVALGIAIGSSRTLDRATAPTIDFVRSLPAPAKVPVIVILLGPGLQMGILVIVLTAMFPVLLATISARQQISPVRLAASRTIGLTRVARLRKVVLPSIVPGVAPGVRLAISYALVIAILVDIVGGTTGIGNVLVERQALLDAESVYGIVLAVGIFGYLLNLVVGLAEKAVLRNWGPGA